MRHMKDVQRTESVCYKVSCDRCGNDFPAKKAGMRAYVCDAFRSSTTDETLDVEFDVCTPCMIEFFKTFKHPLRSDTYGDVKVDADGLFVHETPF